ncbi:hypothetical protein PVAND_002501 [Polypedilum vanderplanki]|uniref:FLYWCH-type domain-containing protein n=1 Tax=Polypedilum vanderplanki TaxID=319348 RepID=A0A9J6BR70_POLVA|nr:hypothetical protein PVAND_002501 [Polypedilum vanderplanki]
MIYRNCILKKKLGYFEAAYFDTVHGGKGLLINNYVFKKHFSSANVHYWVCTLNRRLKCKARAITKIDNPMSVQITCPNHNHTKLDYKTVPREYYYDGDDGYEFEEVDGKLYPAAYYQTDRGSYLNVNGFYFLRNSEGQNTVSWRCTCYRSYKCRARAKITKSRPNEALLGNAHHTHDKDAQIEYFENSKKIPRICWEGFFYRINTRNPKKLHWSCDLRSSLKCRAALTTRPQNPLTASILSVEHNHDRNAYKRTDRYQKINDLKYLINNLFDNYKKE